MPISFGQQYEQFLQAAVNMLLHPPTTGREIRGFGNAFVPVLPQLTIDDLDHTLRFLRGKSSWQRLLADKSMLYRERMRIRASIQAAASGFRIRSLQPQNFGAIAAFEDVLVFIEAKLQSTGQFSLRGGDTIMLRLCVDAFELSKGTGSYTSIYIHTQGLQLPSHENSN
jgi:hypothetical protein